MNILINPGSDLPQAEPDAGWTNTYEDALAEARRWHQSMVEEGFGADVELVIPAVPVEVEGRWTFGFRHRVTGVVVELETHGISPMDTYMEQNIFRPRMYWDGSSCGNPELSDWAAPGFVPVQTFRAQG